MDPTRKIQATLNHTRQLYHRLVARLPHLLAVAIQLALSSLAGTTCVNLDVMRSTVALAAAACAGVTTSWPRPTRDTLLLLYLFLIRARPQLRLPHQAHLQVALYSTYML
jgi:hypothetical protein